MHEILEKIILKKIILRESKEITFTSVNANAGCGSGAAPPERQVIFKKGDNHYLFGSESLESFMQALINFNQRGDNTAMLASIMELDPTGDLVPTSELILLSPEEIIESINTQELP